MDYIKAGDRVFLTWLLGISAYLQIHGSRIGLPAEVLTALDALIGVFQEKLAVTEAGNAGSADVAARKTARRPLEQAIRALIRTHIRRNPAVTDEDLVNMKLSIWKTGKSLAPPPVKRPSWKALHKQYGELAIVTDAKPARTDRLEIWYVNVKDWDMAEKDYTKMSHMAESSTTHTILKLPQGETYFIALRWAAVRSKTAKGPWSSPRAETIS
jgi:hypothetical protein